MHHEECTFDLTYVYSWVDTQTDIVDERGADDLDLACQNVNLNFRTGRGISETRKLVRR
jgi:hypothetical protein